MLLERRLIVTINELIAELTALAEAGAGHAQVIIEETGEGYAAPLSGVDTLLTAGGRLTLTLLGDADESGR